MSTVATNYYCHVSLYSYTKKCTCLLITLYFVLLNFIGLHVCVSNLVSKLCRWLDLTRPLELWIICIAKPAIVLCGL